jgi:hypothetical protein
MTYHGQLSVLHSVETRLAVNAFGRKARESAITLMFTRLPQEDQDEGLTSRASRNTT